MEKQDLDNLQRTTRDYSTSAEWVDDIINGIIFITFGLLTYFKVFNSNILLLLFFVSTVAWDFTKKHLKRNMMRKGLGYVKQVWDTPPLKKKSFWKGVLIGIPLGLIIALCALLGFDLNIKSWNVGIIYPLAFLCFGFIIIILLLKNRKGMFFHSTFYLGVYFIICALILMFPMRHLFYAHETAARWGIMMTLFGLGGMLSGIINYFRYKNIIQKVKETN
ncbi:MAG: hypothetical protein WC614_09185 [bacterium]